MYKRQTSNVFKFYNGTAWVDPSTGSYTSWTVTADNGATVAVVDGATVDWAGGTGITTSYATPSGNRTVTTTLDEATSTVRGGIELFSDTDQSVAANSVTTTASRTYGIQLNSAGQAVVNVPWTDTSGMSSWTIAGAQGGSSATVSDAETVTFTGSQGLAATIATGVGTRTLTIQLKDTTVTACLLYTSPSPRD